MAEQGTSPVFPEVIREPVLGILRTERQVGQVRQNYEKTIHVRVPNTGAGGEDLRVRVSTSDEWIHPGDEEFRVPAGTSRTLKITLRPGPEVATGEFRATVTLESDDAAVEDTGVIEFHGRIIRDVYLTATPEEVDLGDVVIGGDRVSEAITVARSDGEAARPAKTEFHADDFGFAHSIFTWIDDDTVTVSTGAANREPGHYEGTLAVNDEDERVTPVKVPLHVHAIEPFEMHFDGEYHFVVSHVMDAVSIAAENTGETTVEVTAQSDGSWLSPVQSGPISVAPGENTPIEFAYDFTDNRNKELQATVRLDIRCEGGPRAKHEAVIAVERKMPALQLAAPARITAREGNPTEVEITLRNRGQGDALVLPQESPSWLEVPEGPFEVPAGTDVPIAAVVNLPANSPVTPSEAVTMRYNAPPDANAVVQAPLEVRNITAAPSRTGAIMRVIAVVAILAAVWFLTPYPQAFWQGGASDQAASEPPGQPPTTGPQDTADSSQEASTAPAGGENRTAEDEYRRGMELKDQGQGSYSEAIACFERVLALDPDHEDTLWALAWVYAEPSINNREKAIQTFEKFIEVTDDAQQRAEAESAIERLRQRE